MDRTDERARRRGLRALWDRLRRWGRKRAYLTDPVDERARQAVAHEARRRRRRAAPGGPRAGRGSG